MLGDGELEIHLAAVLDRDLLLPLRVDIHRAEIDLRLRADTELTDHRLGAHLDRDIGDDDALVH